MLRSQNRNKKIQLAAAALKCKQIFKCLVLSSIIIKPLSCCARWSSSAWARSRFWIANSKNASDKCLNMNVYKNSRWLWWDRISKIMCIYSNNKCMCVFLISPVPISEPLTSELIDTPVFHNLAPRPIKYRVSVPIPIRALIWVGQAPACALGSTPECWVPSQNEFSALQSSLLVELALLPSLRGSPMSMPLPSERLSSFWGMSFPLLKALW